MRSARSLFTVFGVSLLAAGAVAAGLYVNPYQPEAVRGDNAVGDAACLSCHEEKASFEQTSHRLTLRLPAREAIAGSFSRPDNVLRTSNPNLYFRMDSTATGFYQTAVIGRAPDTSSRTERIAFVAGSGRRGQSYLYWDASGGLYQLPVSYWRALGWANSPGYPDGRPNFERPIPPRCLECHATWFEAVPEPTAINRYQRTGALLGITCETCHGSGRNHVKRERSVLRAVLPSAIVNAARLPRERQVDGCALCHGGTTPLQTAPFSYVPGQPLEKRVDWLAPPDTGSIDVHGNQVALLERSRCFRMSQMTCATCHDVHREQRDVVAISGRCLTCHTMHGPALAGRCVDCHMPVLSSNTAISNYRGHQVQQPLRTHWIKVYR